MRVGDKGDGASLVDDSVVAFLMEMGFSLALVQRAVLVCALLPADGMGWGLVRIRDS